jgi:hypothetical protein
MTGLQENLGVLKSPRGISNNIINEFPLIDFAYFSNSKINKSDEEMQDSATINFNPIDLNWCNFQLLFFEPGSKYFSLNQANVYTNAFSFNQTYQDVTNKTVPFSLYTSVLNAWAVKNSLSTASIATFKKIDLSRETYLINSLANIRGAVSGLNLNECIDLLVKNGDIIYTGDEDTYATVIFKLVFRYDYLPLKTSINVYFQYRTNIPSYINNTCDTHPYSNDIMNDKKNNKIKPKLNFYDEENSNSKLEPPYNYSNNYAYDNNSVLSNILSSNKNKDDDHNSVLSNNKNKDDDHNSVPSQHSSNEDTKLITAGNNIINAVEEIVSKYIKNNSSYGEEESTVNWALHEKDDSSIALTIHEANPMHK